MEKLIAEPKSAFFLVDPTTDENWLVIVTHRYPFDLEAFKAQNDLDHQCLHVIIKQLIKARNYLAYVREVVHHDFKPRNILVSLGGDHSICANNIQIKITDFGLSGNISFSTRRGGTPIYAPPEVFSGGKGVIDKYSLARTIHFLMFDICTFLQLTFFPIEDENQAKKMKSILQKFWILKQVQKWHNPCTDREDYSLMVNMERWHEIFNENNIFSFLQIKKENLIAAEFDENWFIDLSQPICDTVKKEHVLLVHLRFFNKLIILT